MARGVSRFDEAALQQRLWTPGSNDILPNLWLDGANLSTITSGSVGISEWRNAIGTGANATQATSSSQPFFLAQTIGIRSGVNYTSGARFFNTSFSASSAAETIFLVTRATSGANRTIISASANGGRLFRISTDGQLAFTRRNISLVASSGVGNTVPFGTNILIGMTYNSTETQFFYNGAQLGATTTVNPALTAGLTSLIGVNTNLGVEPFAGVMGELIIYQSVLSKTDRQRCEGYLAWKWGLQSQLAADHPFIPYPPMI